MRPLLRAAFLAACVTNRNDHNFNRTSHTFQFGIVDHHHRPPRPWTALVCLTASCWLLHGLCTRTMQACASVVRAAVGLGGGLGWRAAVPCVRTVGARWMSVVASAPTSATVAPEEAAETSSLCSRQMKIKQTASQNQLAEDVAHIFGREPTFHELSLFKDEGEPLARIDDHGYMYGITEEDLDAVGASDAVRKAVSTHAAGVGESRRFRLQQVIDKYKLAEFDTGSSRVQGTRARGFAPGPASTHVSITMTIMLTTLCLCPGRRLCTVAVITEHINAMTKHMVAHPHDKHAKRALDRYLVRRRKLLQYMMRKDYNNYRCVGVRGCTCASTCGCCPASGWLRSIVRARLTRAWLFAALCSASLGCAPRRCSTPSTRPATSTASARPTRPSTSAVAALPTPRSGGTRVTSPSECGRFQCERSSDLFSTRLLLLRPV